MDVINDDSLQAYSKLKTSTDFCLECGDLLDLPLYSDFLECPKCGFKISLLDYPFEEIVTTKVFTEKKPWLEKYNERVRKGLSMADGHKDVEEGHDHKNQRPTIDQECPKCGHNKMFYTSRQMRSADEGETVIYECVKCGHTYALNS